MHGQPIIKMCTLVCVFCCCVWCDGKPIECRSSYGDVRPLSFHIQEYVMCLPWKATRRKLSVVQKYQDVKIIWAPGGTNTKTQSITLVVHTVCVLVYICVCDFSVCGCVYWQPWPFWSELYATGEERNAQRSVYILNILGLWIKHLESFEMWCWRRMEKISWTDHVRNEDVLLTVKEQRNILHEVRKRKANWIGHILRRNCLLWRVTEGKIKGGIEMTGRQGRRRRKLLGDRK
jgi:hypothetical protein